MKNKMKITKTGVRVGNAIVWTIVFIILMSIMRWAWIDENEQWRFLAFVAYVALYGGCSLLCAVTVDELICKKYEDE